MTQASIFRRNYHLMRANHHNDDHLQQSSRERQVYTETARVINQMISNIKNLLLKASAAKEELEAAESQETEGADPDDILDQFKQFQKAIPLTFFSEYAIDNKMVGAFVLRLGKEMGYWRKHLPFLGLLVKEVDEVFQEQKSSENENISLIYFITIKKIITQTNEDLQKIKKRMSEAAEEIRKQKKERQPTIFILPEFRISSLREEDRRAKDELLEKVNIMIHTNYKDLQVEAFEVAYSSLPELKEEENAAIAYKKQIKRNKKAKKEIKAYKAAYQLYEQRRVRSNHHRQKSKGKGKSSVNKKMVRKSGSHHSLSLRKKGKILFPLINVQQEIDGQGKKKSVKQGNGKCVGQKPKVIAWKLKFNKQNGKLKL